MSRSQRRFPRLPINQTGELQVRVGSDGKSRRVRVPVSIRSLAPEGVGLAMVERDYLPLKRGSQVIIYVNLDGTKLELPGSVAWSNRPEQRASPFDLGIRLHLELALGTSRQTYANWVVRQLSAQRQVGT
jgi:hypothetical protein